ncbi:2-phospho-L-lactate transferase CofD family protein, partial [Streptococcus pneumoniae]|uniref:2-phospho-L-lactate transferase CofD family protein n=1 Tax=Streptococcus pneumoniae TaxID=1313 RepID=UPI002B22AB8F
LDQLGIIDNVYVTKALNDDTPLASRRVVQTILETDMIVLGPGSLFTSLLPNIVIKEIGRALLESKAEIAYDWNQS